MSSTSRKLALGSVLRVVNLGATALVSLLIMPFVVHSLGDRMYGIWALVAMIVGYYGTLELGISPAVIRYMARALSVNDQNECNRVFNTAVRLLTAVGGVTLLITFGLAFAARSFARNPVDASILWKLLIILGVYAALSFPTRALQGTLEAALRYDRTASFDLVTVAVKTTLIIVILLRGYKVVALALVTVLSGIPAIILLVYFIPKDLPFLQLNRKYWSLETARKLFSYGFYNCAGNIANIIRSRVDLLVVAWYVGLAAVTHYRVAGVLITFFTEMMGALTGFLPSVFSRQEGAAGYEGFRNTYFFSTKVSICVASFVGFGLIAWGKPFIYVWMGPRYLDAYPVLVLLAAGQIVTLAQLPSPYLLLGIAKHKYTALANSLEAAANLALTILLAKHYGLIGVAVGTLIPMVFFKLFVQPVYVCWLAKIPLREYAQRVAKTGAAVAGALVVPLALSLSFAGPSYKALFSVGVLSALVYVVPLWSFEFSRAETTMLKLAIRPMHGVKTTAE
jgi:O-antigen/teichoic acid export membrane protein